MLPAAAVVCGRLAVTAARRERQQGAAGEHLQDMTALQQQWQVSGEASEIVVVECSHHLPVVLGVSDGERCRSNVRVGFIPHESAV